MNDIKKKNDMDIDDFLKQIELIRESSYLQRTEKQKVEVNWDKDKGLYITNTPMPSRESVEAFLMRIRPVIVRKERLYTGKIIKILLERSQDEKEKEALLKLQHIVETHENRALFSIKVDNKEYKMHDFMWLYLYGKYFHIDEEKKIIIQQFENTFGPLTEISALSQVEAYAGFAMITARYIKKRKSNP
jgi:hypothetical protein